jgi:rhodanese-related sulfurtransferase
MTMTNGSLTQIPVSDVAGLVAAGAAFIDVREHQETSAGAAPGTTVLPLQSLTVDQIPTGVPLVFICRSGRRSDSVASALAGMGYTTYNVVGGMQAWAAAGLPVIAEDGTPGMVL